MYAKEANQIIAANHELIAASGPYPKEFLGNGALGCVYATETENVVFKITRDWREAAFVKRILDHVQYYGLVRYYQHVRLGLMAGLWREEVFGMGSRELPFEIRKIIGQLEDAGDYLYCHVNPLDDVDRKYIFRRANALSADARLLVTKESTFDTLDISRFRDQPEMKVAILLEVYHQNVQRLRDFPLTQAMSYSLSHLFREGIVLSDISLNNIGMVNRTGSPMLVIADPSVPIHISP